MLSLKLGGLVVYNARLAFAASKGPADCAVSPLSRCFMLFLLLEMLNSQMGMFFVWFLGAGCGCESVSRSTCANGSYRGVQG
jgi:hypothetical protein